MKLISMYWNNIDPRIVQAQAATFAHLGFTLEQVEATGMAHGVWLDGVMTGLGEDETVLFIDIDCIPTRRDAITSALDAAERGIFYGVAQTANHKDTDHVYVSPVFMCLSKKTWRQMGSPSFQETEKSDAGQQVTRVAQERGVPVQMMMPTGCLKPMWNLADIGMYGIGTFYQSGIFHLFQSRKRRNIRWFLEVADLVLTDKRIDLMQLHARYSRGFGLF